MDSKISTGNLTVSGGASLSLPGITSYTGNTGNTTLEATGANSTPDPGQPHDRHRELQRLPGPGQFEALAGGTVNLTGLKTIDTGTVVLEADGASSVLNVSALTGFTEANGWTNSTLQATNGGTVHDGSLDHSHQREPVHRRELHHRHGPAHLLHRRIDDDQRGIAQLRRLATFTGSNITVSGGGTLSLPRGHQLHRQRRQQRRWRRPGPAARLTLANLTTVTESSNAYQAQVSSRPWPAAP